MKLPKIKTQREFSQAQILMQPTFIRVVDNIRKESESLNWLISYEEIEEPFPSYIVCLQKDNHQVKKNVWQLCFEICFINYSEAEDSNEEVKTDQSLFDQDGELNWQKLETKTKALVQSLFQK
jgi:hypothetical protein